MIIIVIFGYIAFYGAGWGWCYVLGRRRFENSHDPAFDAFMTAIIWPLTLFVLLTIDALDKNKPIQPSRKQLRELHYLEQKRKLEKDILLTQIEYTKGEVE